VTEGRTGPMLGDLYRFDFGRMLERIWKSSFTHTVIGVLCGSIGMSSISDFRFIIPAYSRVLKAAYEQMSRNDYLLTVAILGQAQVESIRVNATDDIAALQFDSCTCSWGRWGGNWGKQELFFSIGVSRSLFG